MSAKIIRSEAEWRRELAPEVFRVTRQRGTEAPFSGRYVHCATPGRYRCVCCGQELFDARAKFDSGTGWPSFFAPLTPGCVETRLDRSHGMVRQEVRCSRCDAHLGHVFPDGPEPTGLRYCLNSVALELVPAGES